MKRQIQIDVLKRLISSPANKMESNGSSCNDSERVKLMFENLLDLRYRSNVSRFICFIAVAISLVSILITVIQYL